ncbi:MAG: protein kinase [Anaerolineales bacterium]
MTDFGIARALSTIMPDERADVVWGSPQYFSPEQAVGEPPSPASDVYSLGVVLYEVLAGALPFNAPTSEELARMHLEDQPIPISEYVPDVPPALEQIVMKVLSKEPSARYRTADQLGRVLPKFGTQRETSTPALHLTPGSGDDVSTARAASLFHRAGLNPCLNLSTRPQPLRALCLSRS